MQSAQPRILIVDDEETQMRALCDTLRDRGYSTTGFTSGEAALNALRLSRFELLLADLTMPGMDGIALLQATRQTDPDLVGIIMTGEGTIATAVKAMRSGALDYILKPFKVSVILPVLERALAVRQLRMQNVELERRIHERTIELEAANKELEAFSYSVSHDLRAPLRAINGFADILTQSHAAAMPAEARHLLGVVVKNAQYMGQLIDGLLRLSSSGRQPLHKRNVDVSALARQVVDQLRDEQGGQNVQIQIGDLPESICDPTLIRQVFVNLLSNAFKFSRHRPQPVIEIGYQREAGETVYSIRDNGAGFDSRRAQKLFAPFQRLHSAEEFEGSGIGLSIAHRIIQRHGGRIWAESEIDKGATFRFSLP